MPSLRARRGSAVVAAGPLDLRLTIFDDPVYESLESAVALVFRFGVSEDEGELREGEVWDREGSVVGDGGRRGG